MAEPVDVAKKGADSADMGKILIYGGLLLIAGYGVYKMINLLGGSQDWDKLLDSLSSEVKDLAAYQGAIAAQGREPNELEQQAMEAIIHGIDHKSEQVEAGPESVVERTKESIVETIQEIGFPVLWGMLGIGALYLLGPAIYRFINKKRPPKPPSTTLPNGTVATTDEELDAAVDSAMPTNDTAAIVQAQQIYLTLPELVQDYIKVASGETALSTAPWTSFSPDVVFRIGRSGYEADMYAAGTIGALASGLAMSENLLIFAL
jgi:hypothetical protein